MSAPQNGGDKSTPPNRSPVLMLLGDIGDTTWRMFVPSIGLALLGWYADSQFGTKPWMLLVGIAIGAALAYVLVRNQINRIKEL